MYLRASDSEALDHIRHSTGIKSAAEAIRLALHHYARERGWEPSPTAEAEAGAS